MEFECPVICKVEGRRTRPAARAPPPRGAMPLLVSPTQKAMLASMPPANLPRGLAATLRANHARVLDLFRALDADADGMVSRGELASTLGRLGLHASPNEVDALFDSIDADGSDRIDFRELQKARSPQPPTPLGPPPSRERTPPPAGMRGEVLGMPNGQ